MRRLGSVVAVTVLGLAGLTACGGSNSSSGGSYGSAPSVTPSPSASAAGGAGAGAAMAKLSTATVGSFGKIVVDGNGKTVYVFDKDTAGKSNCEGGCAQLWPAVAAGSGTPQLTGVQASLVGTITRSDGTKQLTLAGHPLYVYASDSQAGQANGQGFMGIWWVVGPDGKKITTKAGSAPSSSYTSSGNGNGY